MPKAVVFEEFTHVCPTGNGWILGLEDCGFDVYKLSSREYRLQQLDEFIDLIIVHGIDEIKIEDIKSVKSSYPKSKIVVFDGYHPLCDQVADQVDMWMTLCKVDRSNEKEFVSRNMPFGSIELASHPRLVPFVTRLEKDKPFDISFIGTFAHGYRSEDKYLYPLIGKYKGAFAGFSYNGDSYPFFHFSQVPHIYAKTKVNLSFHYHYNFGPERIDLGGRCFDIPMSGNFQLCDHWLAEEYFHGKVPVASADDWEDKLQFYLKNESLRHKYAIKSYEICLAEHTYTHRVKKMLNYLKMI